MSLLVELCEPFFQYVCRLNRSVRKGATVPAEAIRADMEDILREMEQTAASRPELAAQFEQVKLPLIFFADFMVKESDMECARDWKEMGREHGEHAGDEKFFDLLEETLGETGPAADERLLVHYTCLGLGFTGFYTGQPEYLRKTMSRVAARLRRHMDLEDSVLLCPEAYEHVDQSDLIEPPGRTIAGIGVVAVGLVLVLFVVNVVLFRESSRELDRSLERLGELGTGSSVALTDETGPAEVTP